MVRILTFLSCVACLMAAVSCNRCEICSASQNGEVVEYEVCGTRNSRASLINALEQDQDTTGVGPWTCTR